MHPFEPSGRAAKFPGRTAQETSLGERPGNSSGRPGMVVEAPCLHNCRPRRKKNMNRLTIFLYGTLGYATFLVTFLYAVGFIGNFAVPKSMDSPADGRWQTALLIDLGLLLLFALQHSVMARPAFKRLLTRIVPAQAERSTYVLASSLALLLLFWKWRPLGGTVWEVQNSLGASLFYAAYAF